MVVDLFRNVLPSPPVAFELTDEVYAVSEYKKTGFTATSQILFHTLYPAEHILVDVRVHQNTAIVKKLGNALDRRKRFLIGSRVYKRLYPSLAVSFPAQRIALAFNDFGMVKNVFSAFEVCLARTRSGI